VVPQTRAAREERVFMSDLLLRVRAEGLLCCGR